jgi:hypothetical protein
MQQQTPNVMQSGLTPTCSNKHLMLCKAAWHPLKVLYYQKRKKWLNLDKED